MCHMCGNTSQNGFPNTPLSLVVCLVLTEFLWTPSSLSCLTVYIFSWSSVCNYHSSSPFVNCIMQVNLLIWQNIFCDTSNLISQPLLCMTVWWDSLGTCHTTKQPFDTWHEVSVGLQFFEDHYRERADPNMAAGVCSYSAERTFKCLVKIFALRYCLRFSILRQGTSCTTETNFEDWRWLFQGNLP